VLAVAPAITLSLASTSPLAVTGTVAPAGPTVTLDLCRVAASGRRHVVASKRLAAAGGSFHAQFRHLRSGSYVLVARTIATVRYAAGASAPLAVTVP
jgi:hypothetical protein